MGYPYVCWRAQPNACRRSLFYVVSCARPAVARIVCSKHFARAFLLLDARVMHKDGFFMLEALELRREVNKSSVLFDMVRRSDAFVRRDALGRFLCFPLCLTY